MFQIDFPRLLMTGANKLIKLTRDCWTLQSQIAEVQPPRQHMVEESDTEIN